MRQRALTEGGQAACYSRTKASRRECGEHSRQGLQSPILALLWRSISASAISGFVREVRYSAGTPARFSRRRSLTQLSGRKSRNATITGTSPRASVSDTRVWQLAVLPSAEAYCAATPPSACPPSARPYRRLPTRRRCHQRADPLE